MLSNKKYLALLLSATIAFGGIPAQALGEVVGAPDDLEPEVVIGELPEVDGDTEPSVPSEDVPEVTASDVEEESTDEVLVSEQGDDEELADEVLPAEDEELVEQADPALDDDAEKDEAEPEGEEEPDAEDELSAESMQPPHAFGVPGTPEGYHFAGSVHEDGDEIDAEASLPSSYSSVANGYVTSVKNQGLFGTCWAFSAIACIESSALRSGIISSASTLDLSERQLAYFSFNRRTDPLGYTAGDALTTTGGACNYLEAGAWAWLVANAATSWTGVVSESKADYNDLLSKAYSYGSYQFDSLHNEVLWVWNTDASRNQFLDETALSDSLAYGSPMLRVTGVRRIPTSDRADVKQAIVDHGAVQATYYHNDTYYNPSQGSYYLPNWHDTNHIVAIVGWDDNYGKENFNNTPAGDGAWLAKNSWANYWGNDGYFWISYYDADFATEGSEAFAYLVSDKSTYANIYQHDGGVRDQFNYVDSGGSVANVYTAKANSKGERLKAVAFGLKSVNINYSIQVYKGITDASDPTSGTPVLVEPVTGKTTYEGFYTVDLPHPVTLQKGTTYAVVVTYTRDNGNMVAYDVDSTGVIFLNVGDFEFASAVEYGESFECDRAGAKWDDLASMDADYVDAQHFDVGNSAARVKAFTVNSGVGGSIASATVTVQDQTYTGKEVTPNPKVVLNGEVLLKDVDYTVSYENNVSAGIGTAKAIVKGKGVFTGTASKEFSILFKDVPSTAWHYKVVHRAAQLGLVKGYDNGKFGPEDKITRGQVAVVLWNMTGKPAAGSGAKSFPDVKKSAYYYDAVRWASSKGVVNGYADGSFGPNDNVTREQLAVMLANYASKIGELTVSGSAADYASMSDASKVSGYARTSVGWCFKNGILSGSKGKVLPQGNATRAEAAKMIVFLHDML